VIGKHEIFCGEFTMFFYTSLFIASIFVALVILWAYHAVADAGYAIFRSLLPSTKKGPTSHLSFQVRPKTINGTQTPWGWKNHDAPAKMARRHTAMPLNHQSATNTAKEMNKPKNATWVHREERSELGGKAYKVTRKNESVAEGLKTSERPWNW
jgi:hypothetical protein